MAEISGERLAQLIDERRLSQSSLAKMIGVSQPTIGRLISGETRETGKLLELAAALQTNPGYLVGANDDPAPLVSDARAPFHGFPAERPAADTVDIAEFDVSYGLGASYIHDAPVEARRRPFPRSWIREYTQSPFDALFWATGIGDSMEPKISNSDTLLIDTDQRTPRLADKYWAIEMNGMGMVKALRPAKDGGMQILSLNPEWPSEVAYDGEMTVIGRVVAIVRKV